MQVALFRLKKCKEMLYLKCGQEIYKYETNRNSSTYRMENIAEPQTFGDKRSPSGRQIDFIATHAPCLNEICEPG
jgi:hypothetical protein